MRAVCWVLAVLGGCALALAVVIELATGDPAGAGWVLIAPTPIFAAGVFGAFRGPGRRVMVWLLATGATFLVGVCLAELLPLLHGPPADWLVSLARAWGDNAPSVALIGLVGLFPTGVPQRAYERWVLWGAAAAALLLPVLLMVASGELPTDSFPDGEQPVVSPLYLPAAHGLAPVASAGHYSFAAWAGLLAVIMLYLRYRRSPSVDRRKIRWLLAGAIGAAAGRHLPLGETVLLVAAAALLFQPAQRWLERLADLLVFGARLDGYAVLTQFGAMLETSPGPADLLPRLAAAVRDGLGLEWARVRLDLAAADRSGSAAGAAGIGLDDPAEPALAVPLVYAGTTLGRIECGRRRDGPLLEEDRRLLANLAGQAAAAARSLYLTAELSDRLDLIRRQTEELTASRARVAQTQDAERRRIQRDLHDGIQQDLVVLTAKLALARERLRRGDNRAGEPLAELQHDLADLLTHLRDFAHAIHPPVLADQGLLEAIEAQAARLPLEVVIEADPALRGVRYPQHVEAATWYVVSEALTNAVKHAQAHRVLVALAQPNGHLAVEISDDGCGFDQAAVRGLGLAGLADRISIVNGALHIDSGPGRGTTLRAEVPLTAAGDG